MYRPACQTDNPLIFTVWTPVGTLVLWRARENAMPTYTIIGTRFFSKEPVRVEYVTDDAPAARRLANAQGILVDECLSPGEPIPQQLVLSGKQRENEYAEVLRSLHYRAMRRAAFVGGFWAVGLWLLIWLILSYVFRR